MSTVLKMVGITKLFPGLVANDAIDFELKEGEIHALLGENGAGKTTLMNILYGLYEPDEGLIYVRGQKMNIRSPNDAISAGIGMVHQNFKLVETFTVTESIMLGKEIMRGPFLSTKEATRKVEEISQEFRINVPPHKKIFELSVGERQRVEILKVLYRRADILILDEPTAVLTPPEVGPLFLTLKSMIERGKSIIFISHKLKEVMAITDQVTVLRRGKLIQTVNTAETNEQQLAQMMVGRNVVLRDSGENRNYGAGHTMASFKGVRVIDNHDHLAVNNFDLDVSTNEIVCIAGVDGNGQSELAEAIAGIRPLKEGQIIIDGKDLTHTDIIGRLEAGVWFIPSDRNNRGSAIDLSILMNVILKHHHWKPYSKFGILSMRPINDLARQMIEEFDVRCSSVQDIAGTLSGGNLQKLIIARETISKPKFLIAEQPTRGLDVSGIEFVRKLLLKQRDEGAAVLLISADLDEVLALADRIVVMYEGRGVYQCRREEVDMDRLGLAMAGLTQGPISEHESESRNVIGETFHDN